MRKHLLLLSVACLASTAMFAGPRTLQQARQIANAAAQRQGAQLETAAPSAGAKANSNSQTQPYYIFNKADNKGFVIVSGDDQLPEVIGETNEGSFDGSNTQLNDFLKNFASGVKKLQGNDEKTKNYVESLKARRAPEATDSIGPLIGTSWSQYSPYNAYCPTTNNTSAQFGSHAASGCVATAMAQVMYYWKWPAQLKADIPAYTTDGQKYQVAGVSAGATYQWDKMKKSYTLKDEEGMDVVGKLLADVGASVRMDYNWHNDGESVAVYQIVGNSLSTYWDYNASTIAQRYKSNLTLNTWDQYIFNEIKAKRPVLYADDSHCVVIEGYRTRDDQVYVNWGWGGGYNGWYDIDALMLDDESYMNNPSVYVGIMPNDGQSREIDPATIVNLGEGTAMTVSNTREMDDEDFTGTVTFNYTNISNSLGFNGYVAAGVEDGRGFKPITTATPVTLAAGEDSTLTFNYTYPFVIGTTVVYGLVSNDGQHWTSAGNAPTNIIEATATEEELTPATEPTLEYSVELDDDSLDINKTFIVYYYIKNNSKVMTMPSHRVQIYWGEEGNDDNAENYYGYFTTREIKAGEQREYYFTIDPGKTFQKAGTYYFYGFDQLYNKWVAEDNTESFKIYGEVVQDTLESYIDIKGFEDADDITLNQNQTYTVVFTVENNTNHDAKAISFYAPYEGADEGYFMNGRSYYFNTGAIAAHNAYTVEKEFTPTNTGAYYIYMVGDSGDLAELDVTVVDPTGIESVKADKAEDAKAPWYTISGTRLDKKPVQPGVYVHNGKKVVVK